MADPRTNETRAQLDSGSLVFALPPLPYGLKDLEPVLSAETLEIHHGKHHARYVETLNRLLAEQNFTAHTLEEIIRVAQRSGAKGLFNNAAQAWNHSFFWESMAAKPSQPSGPLADAISAAFGSLDGLGQRFAAEGAGHFGSGWVWLIAKHDKLEVISTHDAATPIAEDGVTALLACDVWEHAYYIDYRQDRATWLASWWNKLANWRFAERQYGAALGRGEPWHYPTPTTAPGK
ncbi:superoxide dismutase [Novosphingobium album (ex Liu et al. 2023)]|uniref:Superoxide dismutase n=1 Tax=Novosphingobium album (ex Liu et al. 2023) TaxID=3031130 RepID=A0ABT5WKU3_9SPHN|nr:superoxide dismutase [Novosphingobium album (ex Liu et al. 2023)]MDE8650657.1 superoxide dismutase [Novosphingobium album (ex Liu et al. 2023)]